MSQTTFTAQQIVDSILASGLDETDQRIALREIGVEVPNRKLKVLVEFDLNQDEEILDSVAKYTADDIVSDYYDHRIDGATVLSASWVDEEVSALV